MATRTKAKGVDAKTITDLEERVGRLESVLLQLLAAVRAIPATNLGADAGAICDAVTASVSGLEEPF